MLLFQFEPSLDDKQQEKPILLTAEELVRLTQPSPLAKKTACVKFKSLIDVEHKKITIRSTRFDGQKKCFPLINDENVTYENCEFTNCSGIRDLKLQNFGPLKNVEWNDLDNFNVIVGKNGLGKSFLLRALYCALKSAETFQRGNEPRTLFEILSEQLYWTFQTAPLGNLVTYNQNEPLKFSAYFIGSDRPFSYEESRDSKMTVSNEEVHKPEGNTIFIPTQDVFSVCPVILSNRLLYKNFGFAEPIVHLATVLTSLPVSNLDTGTGEFKAECKFLRNMLQGSFVLHEQLKRWVFVTNDHIYEMGTVAEGFKKLGILDVLLRNQYLTRRSVLIVDEPEANLHPSALYSFMDVLWSLAHAGVQVFIATHSYFVLKKANILASKANEDVSLGILEDSGEFKSDNLLDGIPSNDIVDETIKLYNESINVSFDFGESEDD